MNWYEKVNRYFEQGFYTVDQVRIFVKGTKITEEEFKQITGEDYIPATTQK